MAKPYDPMMAEILDRIEAETKKLMERGKEIGAVTVYVTVLAETIYQTRIELLGIIDPETGEPEGPQ